MLNKKHLNVLAQDFSKKMVAANQKM